MCLDGRPVLHIVDVATRFSAARFLPKVSSEPVFEFIIMCWSSVYTDLPHCMRVDEGSQFCKIFAELSAIHEFNVKKSGIQSRNSLSVGERYREPLFHIYLKLKADSPSMQRQVLLALAVKSMSNTLGPEGIVPSSVVFGLLKDRLLADRASAAQDVRRIIGKHIA